MLKSYIYSSNKLKKFIAYILLTLFLYNLVGYYPAFILMRKLVKEEMELRIKNPNNKDELTEFIFTQTEYDNLSRPGSKEIIVQGQLYDIVDQKADDKGNISVYCINDKKETILRANLEEQIEKNSGTTTPSKNNANILKLLSNTNIPVNKIIYFLPEEKRKFDSGLKFRKISFFKKDPTPPPEMV